MTRVVDIVDTTTRDGNQSLWGATGLTARDILAIAPTMERVGFHALDFTSSTHMAVSVRFHREDPWELIRLMRAAMPNTPLNFITTGMRFIAWQPCDEDVMRLAFRCVVRNGIRRFQFAEPANDPVALRRVARMAREEGVEEIVVGLTYSISPVHTHAYYAERLAALADCADIDRFYLKDPGGLLTTDAVRELAPHFVATGRTVELHSHCTIGLAPLVYMDGLDAGFHVLHTAIGPAGSGTSQPTVESTLRNLEADGYTHALDPAALAEVSEYFRDLVWEKRLPPGAPREYDAAYYHHQLPGGMVTTTTRMLDEIGRPELFAAVLEEVVRVRAEMGYPILVTPVSQFMATQAIRNVSTPSAGTTSPTRRCATSSATTASFAAPPDPDIADQVLSLPKVDVAARRAAGQPRGSAAALRRRDLRRGAAAAPDDAAGAGRRDARRAADRRADRARRRRGSSSARPPAARGRAAQLDLVPARAQGRRPGGVAPCLLTASAAFVFDIDGTLVHRTGPEEVHVIPGARDVLERVAASGRPFAVFTNGSHVRAGRVRAPVARRRAAGRGRPGAHAALLGAELPRALPRRGLACCRSRPSPRGDTSARSGSSSSTATNGTMSTPSSSRTPTGSTSSSSSGRRAP